MPRSLTSLAGVLLALAVASPTVAMTAEEVIAKHVAARGGAAWAEIESMRLAGSYTSFSKVGPFTILRTADGKYRIDCHSNGHPVQSAYDGEQGWIVNPMIDGSSSSVVLEGLDLQVLMQDVEMATPFFSYQARGDEVELLENGDLDGEEMLRLKLTRPDGFEEVWYLDPETYLETARDSLGSDFGAPHDQRTYFDDFRKVAGVTVPHYVESQWFTRTRIMEVDSVEINPEVDPAIFRRPAQPGMEQLSLMVGDWHVKAEQRPQPSIPWKQSEYETTITSDLDGAIVRERHGNGLETETTWHYDRFREHWVRSSINTFTKHLDIRKGTFDDEGRLTVSNLDTGTEWSAWGNTFYGRTSLFDITEDGFQMEFETSIDGGENWFVTVKRTYSKTTGEPAEEAGE